MSYSVNGFGVADLSWMPSWADPGSAVTPLDPQASVLPPPPEPVQHLMATMPAQQQDDVPDAAEPVSVAAPSVQRAAAPTASLSRSLTLVATKPTQLGMYAGWAGIAALGLFGVSLIWKATHA
jgi:hypothetical protein